MEVLLVPDNGTTINVAPRPFCIAFWKFNRERDYSRPRVRKVVHKSKSGILKIMKVLSISEYALGTPLVCQT